MKQLKDVVWKGITVLVISLIGMSCRESEPVQAPGGQLQLVFDNVVGQQDLQLDQKTYTNGSGESFVVNTLNYYVTNIRLRKADSSDYVVLQDSSYFLVKESDVATQTITLRHLPEGNYTAVSYLIGVDSLRNTMDITRRTGVLNPAGGHSGGMYWDWNSGYIHFKLEGTSPAAPVETTGNSFMYHIGFFGGYRTRTINNLRTITLPLGGPGIQVATLQTPLVYIKADVLKVFDGVTPLSIAQYPDVMISDKSSDIATNYGQMFRVDRLEN